MMIQKQIDTRDEYIRYFEDMTGVTFAKYKNGYTQNPFQKSIADADKEAEEKFHYGYIRQLSNGCSFPTGIVHYDSKKVLKEGATILEIMNFIKTTIGDKEAEELCAGQ